MNYLSDYEEFEMLRRDFEKKKRAQRALAMAAQFPDLTVSTAEERMRRVYWQMPFRHQLYRDAELKKAWLWLGCVSGTFGFAQPREARANLSVHVTPLQAKR